MKFKNKAKPIKFSLLVGGRECRSVEDVKRNFDLGSLCKNFDNGNLQKWLKQIGESSLLNRIDSLSSADLLTKKVCLCHLFSSDPLPSNEVNEDNVLQLLTKGCIKFDDLSDNIEIKKSVIKIADKETVNRLCENDLELLKYVYFMQSYYNLNAQNCRTLINQNIVANEDVIVEIANKKNLADILERYSKLSVFLDGVKIEMIPVKGYSGGNFYIGKYPVTQAQWEAVMGDNPSHFKGTNNPVEQVSLYDCNWFISKLNRIYGRKFRLPRESEWEFAARGGKNSGSYIYSGSDILNDVGWYNSNSGQQSHPVGQKKPNELGIYDMTGNVWEWCEDFYESWESNRVFRGGSWLSEEPFCQVDHRSYNSSYYKSHSLGFRLAMDA